MLYAQNKSIYLNQPTVMIPSKVQSSVQINGSMLTLISKTDGYLPNHSAS